MVLDVSPLPFSGLPGPPQQIPLLGNNRAEEEKINTITNTTRV